MKNNQIKYWYSSLMKKNYTYIEVLTIKLVETKRNPKAPKHNLCVTSFGYPEKFGICWSLNHKISRN